MQCEIARNEDFKFLYTSPEGLKHVTCS